MSYKSKMMLPVLAAIVGVAASAFTVGKTNHVSKSDPFWYEVDPSTHQVIQFIGQETQGTAEGDVGCNNTSTTLCAYGYSTDPGYNPGDDAAQSSLRINKTDQP